MPSQLNLAMMRLTRRAEKLDPEQLVSTFVDVGPLFTLLSSSDHQVIFGRRGTGKTHALKYLEQIVEREHDYSIYIDLRAIGSNNSIYSDRDISLSERATRLILDCSEYIYNALFDVAIETGCSEDKILSLFEILGKEISNIEVVGHVNKDIVYEHDTLKSDDISAGFIASSSGGKISFSCGTKDESQCNVMTSVKEQGAYSARVSFGGLGKVLTDIIKEMSFTKVWILLDEWSAIPRELQPFLADILRRAFFPIKNIVVKIAAIETRCDIYFFKK